ncbi:MAG: hypothetical protein ACKV2O_07390 [Acidimicrobiales bacterium]
MAITVTARFDTVAALALTVSAVLLGGWRLWDHRAGRDFDRLPLELREPFMHELHGELHRELGVDLADECELATFTALQMTTVHLRDARRQLLGLENPPHLVRAVRRLDLAVTEFVFSGEGLGDLAAAWALEDQAHQLAERVASHRRPA